MHRDLELNPSEYKDITPKRVARSRWRSPVYWVQYLLSVGFLVIAVPIVALMVIGAVVTIPWTAGVASLIAFYSTPLPALCGIAAAAIGAFAIREAIKSDTPEESGAIFAAVVFFLLAFWAFLSNLDAVGRVLSSGRFWLIFCVTVLIGAIGGIMRKPM